jgi:tetratricopeptide (TPR) repeat protein
VRAFQLSVLLLAGTSSIASAQLAARQEPQVKLLVLPFQASSADSAGSIALADAVRDRVTSLTKGKVMVVPKAKLCEALSASGFPCAILLDAQQAGQLARFLQVNAYVTGTYEKSGANLTANVRVVDISSSGMPASFVATNGNPGTQAALADAIAQRIAAVVRTSEFVRDCNNERQKGQFARARAAAAKALAADPNSTGAHLCMSTVYEAQRMPIDSVIAASQRALAGDSANGTAWENIARGYQQKGDTLKAVDAFVQQLGRAEPRNTTKRLGIAQLLRQMKQYPRAVEVLDEGLAIIPGDAQLLELKTTLCIEGSLWPCAVEGLAQKLEHDSSLAADTTFLKTAIGAAQQLSDSNPQVKSQQTLLFSRPAVGHFSTNASFIAIHAGALEMAGQADSGQFWLRKALQLDPTNVAASLQIAKSMVDRAVWDTAAANRVPRADTAAQRRLREPFVQKVDSARPYLRPGLASPDSMQRLAASVIMLTAGSKLAQANAHDAAYVWLDTLLQTVAPRTPADSTGPRFQVRLNASFWYGLSSILTFGKEYEKMTKLKGAARCPGAREVFDRLTRTRQALQLGRRVHPPTADQMLGFVARYEQAKPQVQRSFKCSPALN